jgi:hypothetical protein
VRRRDVLCGLVREHRGAADRHVQVSDPQGRRVPDRYS